MRPRLRCIVPGCSHTRGDRKGDPITPGMEWICAGHWRLVPRALKAIRTRARRKGKDRVVLARLWRRIRREAIERALGI